MKQTLGQFCAEQQAYIGLLEYCLIHYDEMLQQLNDELDNCNYFGEDGKTKTTR